MKSNVTLFLAALLLGAGFAYAQTPMPARLEVSLRIRAPQIERDDTGYVEFQLPESGKFSGVGSLVIKVRYTLRGGGTCTSNESRTIPLEVSGKREGQQIKLTVTKDYQHLLKFVCWVDHLRSDEKAPLGRVPYDVDLYVADKANRTISIADFGSINEVHTLRLACPVTVQRPSPPTIEMSPVPSQNPWPLVLDNSQPAEQIKALKAKSTAGGTSLGLTKFNGPKLEVEKGFQKSQFGGGLCVSVAAMTIKYEPIKMFIASKYKPDSCEYRVLKEHENLHYQDISALARKSQQEMKEAGESARLPSREQPWYVHDEAEANRLIDQVIRETFKPIVSRLIDQGGVKTAERDTPGNVDAVLRQCVNW